MNFLRNNLANAFTLGNLFSGCTGVIHLLKGDEQTAAICIAISLILDFFDGFVARALKANSNLGVQLDSLADMVSFGLLPGLTMYRMLEFAPQELPSFVKYCGLFITLFSCLRLAIFNLDEEQKYYFKGLNTPTNTMLIFGLFYAFMRTGNFTWIMSNQYFLLALTGLSCLLLVSPLKMISLKFKSKKLADNYPKIILAGLVVSLLLMYGFTGIPVAVIAYILTSIIFQKQLK